jgi:hypothetical protein
MMLMELQKIAIYAILFVIMYYSKSPGIYAIALVSIFVINIRKIDMKFWINIAALATVGLYIYSVDYYFNLYTRAILPAFWLFVISTLVILVFFYMISGNEDNGEIPELKPQKPVRVIIKTIICIILGLSAWYLLKAQLHIPAAMVYVMSFIQLFCIFYYEKLPGQNHMNIEPNTGEQLKNEYFLGVDFRKLFSLAVILLLVFKMYFSLMDMNYKEPYILFIIAAFIAGIVFTGDKETQPEAKSRGCRRIEIVDIVAMAGLLIVSFLIRILWIEQPGSCCDDPYIINFVNQVISGYKEVFVPDGTIIGPTLLFWIIKNMMIFTGGKLTLITARLLSVTFGSLGVVFTYLLALELFKRRVALLSGILTAFLFIHILYSRQAIGVIEVVALAPLAFYFFIRGIREGGAANWILAGAATGFGLFFYNPAKFVPIILALFMLLYILFEKEKKKAVMKLVPGFLLTALTAFIMYYPILVYAINNPDTFFGRIAYTAGFKNITSATIFSQTLVSQILLTAQIFFYNNFDNSGVFSMPGGKPIINGLNTFLFILGMTGIVFQWKKRNNLLLLIWFFVGLIPGVFSWYYLGGGLRPILAIPAMIIIMALGMEFVASSLEKAAGRYMKIVAPVLISVVLLFVCYKNTYDFFTGYLNDPLVKIRWDGNVYRMGQYVEKFKDTKILNSLFYNEGKFISQNNIFNMSGVSSLPVEISRIGFERIYNNEGKNILILAESMNEKNIGIYREYFPDAKIEFHYNYDYWIYSNITANFANLYDWNNPVMTANNFMTDHRIMVPYDLDKKSKPYIDYISCYIPYEDIKSLYGFNISYYNAGKPAEHGVSDGTIKLSGKKYDRIELKGTIDAKSYGKYGFTCDGAVGIDVFVDGKKYPSSGVILLKGLNRIKISIYNINKNILIVNWKPPDQTPYAPVEFKDVISSDKIFGLICKKTCEDAKVYYLRYYTMRQKYFWWWKTDEPCTTMDREWTGYLDIKTPGYYQVIFKTAYEGEVFVNGARVFDRRDNKENAVEVYLGAGKQKLTIEEKKYQTYYGESIQLLTKKRGDREAREVTYDQLSY